MTNDPFLQSLPILLETKPELFSTADLQDLQQTLAPLKKEPPPENADEILRDWCKARRPIRDALINLPIRELKVVEPSQANQSTRITHFYPELSQQVDNKLKPESKNPDSGKNND